jgi:hypothetical protein
MKVRRVWSTVKSEPGLQAGDASCSLRTMLLCLGIAYPSLLGGQVEPLTPSGPPVLTPLHQDIDWSYYCDSAHKTQQVDKAKCIFFSPRSTANVSIGGELRQRGEYFDHPQWAQNNSDSGYSLQRYMVFASIETNAFLRFYSEIESALSVGRDGGPRPVVDQDQLFLHQAFVELRSNAVKRRLRLRVGRQELSFGSSRLIGIRDGPNVRQSFDGVRLTWNPEAWNVDAIAMKPVDNNMGVFDDSHAHAYSFWGVYATHPLLARSNTKIDIYYFGIDRKMAAFQAGTGREQRQTVGTRVSGTNRAIDHDTEIIFQLGTFAGRPIRAWAVSIDTGYTFARSSSLLTSRIGFDSGIISGNRNPTSGTFGTFNALFPKGSYFGEAQLVGPYNVQVVRPSIRFVLPRQKLTIWPNMEFLWRQSRQDGVYAIPGILVRPGGKSTALYIGQQADINVEWRPTRHFTYALDYLHCFPGSFLKQTGSSKGVNFITPWVTYRF